MSTPISQLPANAPPPNSVPSEDDSFVTGVIQEIEKECNKPVVSAPPPQQVVHAPHPQMYMPVPIATQIAPSKASSSSWYNETFAKRAAIVAVIAFLMFYPNDLSPLYQKAPVLSKFAAYDRIIRMLLLAVVLYVLFWKLNI